MVEEKENANPDTERELFFGPFQLIPARRLLLRGGKPIRLGEPSYRVLLALLEQPGTILDTQTLIARAWGPVHVDETSLRAAIAALRKALKIAGSSRTYIATVSRKGYGFVGPIDDRKAAGRRNALPPELSKVIGREQIIADLTADVAEHRLVTIVGPGGIGKTTTALATARRVVDQQEIDSVCFVDLSNVSDVGLLTHAFRSSLGIASQGNDLVTEIDAFLEDRRVLLVLDSCEGVLTAIASQVEELSWRMPNIKFLVTSREPLRATGERLRRLDALSLPSSMSGLTSAEAMRFSAIELFTDRATASRPDFGLTEENVQTVVEICRRLDGIPLALEIAAARLDSFDLPVLANILDSHFRLQMLGRSTALPRHRTLASTLDWSYDSLNHIERTALRRLSAFTGPFCFEAARHVVGSGDISANDVGNIVASLTAKSLITIGGCVTRGQHRLLDTTRAYASLKLEESGETNEVRRRHALFYVLRITEAAADVKSRNGPNWIPFCQAAAAEVHSALDRAASTNNSGSIAVDLALAAISVWTSLGLGDECLCQTDRILRRFQDRLTPEQHLSLALAQHGAHLDGGANLQVLMRIRDEITELAAQLTDPLAELRAIYGMWATSWTAGRLSEVGALAARFRDSVTARQLERYAPLAEVLLLAPLPQMGEFDAAIRHIETALADPEAVITCGFEMYEGCDHLSIVYGQHALTRMVQGDTDAALEITRKNLERASASGSDLFFCHALINSAIWVAYEVGPLDLAERYVSDLERRSARPGLQMWSLFAECLQAMLNVRRGEYTEAIPALWKLMRSLSGTWNTHLRESAARKLAEALLKAGCPTQAIEILDDLIVQCARSNVKLHLSLILALRAEAQLLEGAENVREIASAFRQALEIAGQQGANLWTERILETVRKACAASANFEKEWVPTGRQMGWCVSDDLEVE